MRKVEEVDYYNSFWHHMIFVIVGIPMLSGKFQLEDRPLTACYVICQLYLVDEQTLTFLVYIRSTP
jgi:hypothetical protein